MMNLYIFYDDSSPSNRHLYFRATIVVVIFHSHIFKFNKERRKFRVLASRPISTNINSPQLTEKRNS
jgi:hypothetical protein